MGSGTSKLRVWSFFAIAGGISLALWGGCSDLRTWMYSSNEPQTIAAQALAENGPGGNYHVVVTDYMVSDDGVGNDNVGFFIIYPQTRGAGQASLVVKTDGGSSYLGVFIPEDGVQGLVRNGSGTFNSDQRNAIKKTGPIDFDNVWIIDHNRRPPAWWSFLLKVAGGVALVGVGVVMWMAAGSDD